MELHFPIYLDNNATTQVDPRVLEEMLPYFTEKYGNAASKTHVAGWLAADAVELARERVAQLIHAEPGEIVFTSGATEAINLAIKGVFETYRSKGNHIITVSTEHKAVLDVCHSLEKQGAKVTYLSVNSEGLLKPTDILSAITPETILICVMLANNETGVIQSILDVSSIARQQNIIFMSDATQAIGKVPVDVQQQGIDLMPLSAHKLYGPKGVGALYIRRKQPRVKLKAQIEGGGHENGLRSGTLNVPGIVGLGKACELAKEETDARFTRIKKLRDKLQMGLLAIHGASVNGSKKQRLPNTLNISFEGIDSQKLMKKMSMKVAVASGSACTSALPEPSYVLKAMGMTDKKAYASVRFSLGQDNTQEEIDYTIKMVTETVAEMREGAAAVHGTGKRH